MIDITNVVNVSVSSAPAGLAPYSINNVLCLTKDTPVVSLGSAKYKVYTNPTDVGVQWGTTSNTYKAAVALFSQSPNILTGGGVFLVAPLVTDETLDAAVSRLAALVYFGAVSYTYSATDEEVEDAADVCQAARKLLFVVGSTEGDLESGGLIHTIQGAGLSYTRCLYYSVPDDAPAYKWGYIGRAMSTNFSASNSTQTMHLKQIAGTVADPGIDASVLAKAKAVGADVYVDIAGRASLMSHGENEFFDDMYNLMWFVGAIEVAGFNALAQTSTKLPQTETGMSYLKGVYTQICEQAIANRYVGPGSWNSPDTFGNQQDFIRNIAERGYYIYSLPVTQQSQAEREQRVSPVVSIAIKAQGAIHSASVIVNVNA